MKKVRLLTLSLILLVTFLISYDLEDSNIENLVEVITTLIYRLPPVGSGDSSVVFSFQDLDGEEGNASIVVEGVLRNNFGKIG